MTDLVAAQPLKYARGLTSELAAACGERLLAGYLHGSAVLGGWTEERSDVDVLVIVADDIDVTKIDAAKEILIAAREDCPGRGLEISLVTAAEAAVPGPPFGFVLHGGDQRLVDGADVPGGDDDLLMHYAVCLAAGYALLGPPPRALIGPVGRPALLSYLAAELDWGLTNAPECYAVLNACRALEFTLTGQIMSKVDGGISALRRGLEPTDLVARALDQQRGLAAPQSCGPEAVAFAGEIQTLIRAAIVTVT